MSLSRRRWTWCSDATKRGWAVERCRLDSWCLLARVYFSCDEYDGRVLGITSSAGVNVALLSVQLSRLQIDRS